MTLVAVAKSKELPLCIRGLIAVMHQVAVSIKFAAAEPPLSGHKVQGFDWFYPAHSMHSPRCRIAPCLCWPKPCTMLQADKGGEAEAKEEGGAAAAEGAGEPAKAPDVPVLLAKGRLCENRERWRSACISLDGLLDYDEEDNDEGTLEMNLFAENFSELLSRDYGRTILDALYQERSALCPSCLRPCKQPWLRACNIGGYRLSLALAHLTELRTELRVMENQIWRSAPLAMANLMKIRCVSGNRALNAIRGPRSAALKRREERKRKREEEDRKAEEAKKAKAAEGNGDKSASAKSEGLKEDIKTAADPEAPAQEVRRLASMKQVCGQQLSASSSQVFPSSEPLARYRLCSQLDVLSRFP